jgi:hypothetical protein
MVASLGSWFAVENVDDGEVDDHDRSEHDQDVGHFFSFDGLEPWWAW